MTGSEWDHIGVVVPGANPTAFYLLEATGDGVSAFPLVSLEYFIQDIEPRVV